MRDTGATSVEIGQDTLKVTFDTSVWFNPPKESFEVHASEPESAPMPAYNPEVDEFEQWYNAGPLPTLKE